MKSTIHFHPNRFITTFKNRYPRHQSIQMTLSVKFFSILSFASSLLYRLLQYSLCIHLLFILHLEQLTVFICIRNTPHIIIWPISDPERTPTSFVLVLFIDSHTVNTKKPALVKYCPLCKFCALDFKKQKSIISYHSHMQMTLKLTFNTRLFDVSPVVSLSSFLAFL